jgi:hypothetical protein
MLEPTFGEDEVLNRLLPLDEDDEDPVVAVVFVDACDRRREPLALVLPDVLLLERVRLKAAVQTRAQLREDLLLATETADET